ncbi:hypothetical protein ABZU75_07865 [Streptosporangium sp. NPDC005286]|uniref:hypothetical protein n=1 Tax=Streptosporangium sp. NPDC005286 TaxID=3154463 RepID=UPI0033BB8EB9
MSTRADADAARAAQQVQKYAPTWLVIWSLRHRRFEAWQCTDPARCHIVHATSAAELWDLMERTELALWRTSPHDATPPTPDAAGRPGSPLPVAPELVPHSRALPPGHPERAPEPCPSSQDRSRP